MINCAKQYNLCTLWINESKMLLLFYSSDIYVNMANGYERSYFPNFSCKNKHSHVLLKKKNYTVNEYILSIRWVVRYRQQKLLF